MKTWWESQKEGNKEAAEEERAFWHIYQRLTLNQQHVSETGIEMEQDRKFAQKPTWNPGTEWNFIRPRSTEDLSRYE